MKVRSLQKIYNDKSIIFQKLRAIILGPNRKAPWAYRVNEFYGVSFIVTNDKRPVFFGVLPYKHYVMNVKSS